NEDHFDFSILDNAVQQAKELDIRTIDYQADQQAQVVSQLSELAVNVIVIDIRPPEETDVKPLQLSEVAVIELPFFRLSSQFANLDQSKQYYFYCEKGVMSRLQAVVMQDQGFCNVAVYRP